MKRPYVVCHMMGTLDGRIKTERWSLTPAAEKQYEAVHALHQADAWMCGRETFQSDFLEQKRDAKFPRGAKVPPGDFVVPEQTARPKNRRAAKPVFAIAVDSSGKLRWESNVMRGDRFIVLTTGKAPAGYLADLRSKSISYLIGGRKEIDFASTLVRLRKHFGIRKLMLEGGGSINGALLAAGLIDEISLLVCPYADGAPRLPTVFDTPEPKRGTLATRLELLRTERRPGEVVWLRYRVR
ncbi:MAG TPA: RibD family protein [Opitutaceae bacterium]|nr:RibD family protein [Opitutaceae bacterium]